MNSVDHIHELDTLLNKLQVSSDQAFIEYGDKDFKGGMMSAYRIRYIATPGGMQYAIKPFDMARGEGSGMYFTDRTKLYIKLSELLALYEKKDERLQELMKRLRPEGIREAKLSFNFYEDDKKLPALQVFSRMNTEGPLY